MSYGHPNPAGGYGTGGYGPPSGGYGAMPPAGGPPKNYLVWNILGIFSVTVIGIIGLIFALQVNSKWESGDYMGAESSAQVAKIMGIISLIFFIIMAVVTVAMVLIYLGMLIFVVGAAGTGY